MRKLLISMFIPLLKLLAITWRISNTGEINNDKAVIAFWHGKMLPFWKIFSKKDCSAVISLSNDGEVLAHLLRSWNYKVLRGSSSKRGKEVLEEMIVNAKKSKIIITPDGPKGPIYKIKPGAVITAQKAAVPLVLCKADINWKIVLQSWDKFEIPLPFSKINVHFLPPLIIPLEADRNEISMLILKCEMLLSESIK